MKDKVIYTDNIRRRTGSLKKDTKKTEDIELLKEEEIKIRMQRKIKIQKEADTLLYLHAIGIIIGIALAVFSMKDTIITLLTSK